VLAVAEVALASMVLVSALLLARGFVTLLDVDHGFNVSKVLTMRVSLSPKYSDPSAATRFFDEALARIREAAAVQSAAAVTQLPLSGAMLGSTFTAGAGGEQRVEVDLRGVTPDYFHALDIAILEGRALLPEDTESSRPVAVIDETLARRLFPARPAVGERIRWARQPERDIEVVGVARAVRHRGPSQAARETVYRPHSQYARRTMFVVVRTRGEPSGAARHVTAAIQALDPDQPVAEIVTMETLRHRALGHSRFGAVSATLLGGLALILALVGVYGVLAVTVAQRRREVGIRLALGASPARVARSVIGEAALIGATGLAAGLGLAVLLSRWIGAHVHGAAPPDLPTFGAAGAILLGAVLMACAGPAFRAARIAPASALRLE
jgi:putative ABC transport system permease protein